MKSRLFRLWLIAVVIQSLTLACGNGVGLSPPLPEVTVSPDSATIQVGEQVELVAEVEDTNGELADPVVWASSDTAVATVSASGFRATVTGVALGDAIITASVEGASGSAVVVVTAP